jgi:hypothetical protein
MRENPCDVFVNIEESPSGKSQRTQDLSLSSHDFYSIRHTSIVTSRHLFMIAVTVRVNNHCPAFFKLVAIYSWLPNNCLCIEQYLCDVYYKNRVTTALLGPKEEGLVIVNF